ncbi:MAG: beta-galactosidase [Gammaproteobacteria bacterium]
MFGVCYYPEHWDQERWSTDAKMMVELGLRYVRIGEFAWSRMEPAAGEYHFDWLDQAIETLGDAGLHVVMCTPTATPPKWLVDQFPDVLAVDPDTGRTRGFGSRRHYDFASATYQREALRISEVLARRYGNHPHVVGWQTDNELCCHDTTLSASDSARRGFIDWCRTRYQNIDQLNRAWGNVFWSMEYPGFEDIELPVGAVTETNPAHQLAWRRFSSAKVIEFHNRMVEVIRAHTADQFVTHNFIPTAETGVDNFALAAPLDFVSYDNYPLGRTDLQFTDRPADEFRRYMRTGHPDFSTYYFDHTRGLLQRGFWIMEQQPGPVNWADSNPRPAPGMIRLWTLEAFAHGADCVCYFRWRQARFAQEQMHAGLLRPDHSKSAAWAEAERAIADAATLKLAELPAPVARVALVTAAESYWVAQIEHQSRFYDFNNVQLQWYRALRELGLNVDIVSDDSDLSSYDLVVVPGLPIASPAFVARCQATSARIVFGPRSGAKTAEFEYPDTLPPAALQALIPIRVLSVETLRPDCYEALEWNGQHYQSTVWREELDDADVKTLARYEDGTPAVVQHDRVIYCATLTDRSFQRDFLRAQCAELGIPTTEIHPDVRVVQRGRLRFAFSYADEPVALPIENADAIVLGQANLLPRDLTVWTDAHAS